jgi:hypothetical protein
MDPLAGWLETRIEFSDRDGTFKSLWTGMTHYEKFMDR